MTEELLRDPPKRGPGRPRKDEQPSGSRKLLPSPPVGTPVVWYKCGDKRFPCPAVVLENDGTEPSHLDLSICIGSGWVRQPNVTWEGDPEHQNPMAPQIRNNGAWGKCHWYEFTAADYEVHEALLLAQEQGRIRAEAEAEQRKRDFEAMSATAADPRAVQVARLQAEMILNS